MSWIPRKLEAGRPIKNFVAKPQARDGEDFSHYDRSAQEERTKRYLKAASTGFGDPVNTR